MRRCLTRYGLGDDLGPVVLSTPLKRRAWQLVLKLLSRRDMIVLRLREQGCDLREAGHDWPVAAETMIGMLRLENIQSCVDHVLREDIPGDLIETGVWRGGGAIFMRAVLAARDDHDRIVWVADSFQGLPPPKPEHVADHGDLHFTQPYLAVSLEEVKANFEKYGLLDDQVRFLPGWFNESLVASPIERLSVLRVDCDMYGSTMDVLTALYPRLSVGGYIIVDDYSNPDIPGCKAAVDEYRAAHGISESIVDIDWTGVYWRREH